LILLALHPEIQDKLYKEVSQVIGTRLPVYEDFSQLLYAQYIMKETLRLFPPALTIAKKAVKDTTLQVPLAKYQTMKRGDEIQKNNSSTEEMITLNIPNDTVIMLHVVAMHRNPHYWPEPDQFIPERFDPASDVKKYREEKKRNRIYK